MAESITRRKTWREIVTRLRAGQFGTMPKR
jgi:hypothetical protein